MTMENNHWTYDLLKELIAQKSVTSENLEEIKKEFAEEIGSSRRYSCIRTLQDLLDILEKRNEINEYKIEALNDLGYYFDDTEINEALSQYNQVELEEFENEYALERIETETQEQLRINGNISQRSHYRDDMRPVDHLYSAAATATGTGRMPNNEMGSYQFEGKKRELIYKLITSEIGRRWREFGREIGIREGEMDNLELDHPRNAKMRIWKMLELYEEDEKTDPRRIVLQICSALDICRRADLTQKVLEIMAR